MTKIPTLKKLVKYYSDLLGDEKIKLQIKWISNENGVDWYRVICVTKKHGKISSLVNNGVVPMDGDFGFISKDIEHDSNKNIFRQEILYDAALDDGDGDKYVDYSEYEGGCGISTYLIDKHHIDNFYKIVEGGFKNE